MVAGNTRQVCGITFEYVVPKTCWQTDNRQTRSSQCSVCLSVIAFDHTQRIRADGGLA